MGELSIKIKIGDREYPMKVAQSEEARLRQAGKMINGKLKSYKDQFGIDDLQDLLAMVAFDCMVEKMRQDEIKESSNNNIMDKISRLNSLISDDTGH